MDAMIGNSVVAVASRKREGQTREGDRPTSLSLISPSSLATA